MSANNNFAEAIAALSALNSVSQSISHSDANLETLQNQLFNTIRTMVRTNRNNAILQNRGAIWHQRMVDQRMQQAIAAGNVTVRQPRPQTGPYTAPLRQPATRYNPLEKAKVIAKKKLDSNCPSECSVCQETPKYKDAICTECEHYYCKTCWTSWMNAIGSNKKCPTCRKDMPRTTSYKARASTTKRGTGPLSQRPIMIISDDENDEF
jgi:Zinc finger, C3HC4 type (RING finger)